MSAASHQPANATHNPTANAGVPPAPSATRQGAGEGGDFVVLITSSEHGQVEDPWPTLEEAKEAFASAQRAACFGPADQFGDIVQVQLFSPAGKVLLESPRWAARSL